MTPPLDVQAETVDLRTWLLSQDLNQFPGRGNRNYLAQFENVESYLFNEVHPEVAQLAMQIDGGYLTDHGPEHIRTVIDRASYMIGNPATRLSPYEAYILLVAIHLHDVGNIYGRRGHEVRLNEVIRAAGARLGDDTIEIRMIRQIAEAHGGMISGGDVDPIGKLLPADHFLSCEVRPQLLAALLRFADELSDDSDRASRLALNLGLLPPDAELYHQYARHLHSVKVRPELQLIELRYNLDADTARKKFDKNSHRVYLLDEIVQRSLKMHTERLYCSRYLRRLSLERIDVTIDVFTDPSYISPFTTIVYSLRDAGYPRAPKSISELVPGFAWTGTKLKRELPHRPPRRQP